MNRYMLLISSICITFTAYAQDEKLQQQKNYFLLKDFESPSLIGQPIRTPDVPDPDPRPTPDPFVPPTIERCITNDFLNQIKLGPINSPKTLSIAGMEFSVASYTTALNTSGCPADSTGIAIHFGLTGNSSSKLFNVALEFGCLVHKGGGLYDFTRSADHYIISNGALVKQTGPIINWKSHWTDFTTNVVFIDDLNGSPRAYDKNKDVEYVIYPHTEINQLIDDNGMASTDKFQLKPTAEATDATATKGFRQGMVWIPLNVTLDDIAYNGQPFRHKGADLGAPCPEDCPPKIVFRTSGITPRANCR